MGPPYVTGVFGRVFVVRWVVFTLHALAEVRGHISTVRREQKRRLVYLSLIPGSPRNFSDAERDFLGSYVRDLLVHDCESIHHVIEGAGFAASARRSIVTNLAVASAQPAAFHTHGTLEEALAAIAADTGESEAMLRAEAAGLELDFRRHR